MKDPIPFPTIAARRPADLDSWSPDNRNDYLERERRGLTQIWCPDCKLKGKRLFRCAQHRMWYR